MKQLMMTPIRLAFYTALRRKSLFGLNETQRRAQQKREHRATRRRDEVHHMVK